MSNPAAPFLDTWAPPQFIYGAGGAVGAVKSPDTGAPAMNSQTAQTYNPQITWQVAGTIVIALAIVFALQASGFRFVAAVNVGFGG